MDHNICPLIVKLAETDRDVYVRASALKCLGNMIKIKQFWVHCLSSMNLIERLMLILRHEPEGIIRQEATATLVAISSHQQLPSNIVEVLFSTMAHLATNDLYYGVKIQAIGFWKAYLEELFHNQGALDGKFPKETFSREYKKIVQLTPDQIKTRLDKIMFSYEEKGAFGVLLTIIHDESDLEVLKACIVLIQYLLNRLISYEYVTKNIPMEGVEEVINIIGNHYHYEKVSDEQINFITKAYSKLQTNDYESKNQIDNMDSDLEGTKAVNFIDTKSYRKFAQITSTDFLHVTMRIDLDGLINSKSEWLQSCEGLDSLLDDVILSFNAEKYDLDCY